MASKRTSRRAFFGVSALLFITSAALTIFWTTSMSPMCEMSSHESMTAGWPGGPSSFLGMWVVMMVAMMLPSLVPMLWHYREAVVETSEMRAGRLTVLVGLGYFFVWSVFGTAAFAVGAALASIPIHEPALSRAVPITAAAVLVAGVVQLTAWKARQLSCCRQASAKHRTLPADAGTAWRYGVRLGVLCGRCCANLMAILLVIGVMDLRAMTVVTAAVTAERLAPAGERVARAIGIFVVGLGLIEIARAGIG